MNTKALHFQKTKRRIRLFLGGILFLTGILCLTLSNEIRADLPFILSGLLLLLCGDALYEALGDRHFNETDTENIANAIIYLILAVVVIVKWKSADGIIGAIWGILGLLLASRNISHSLYELIHRKGKTAGHILHLVHALISISISIALLMDPEEHLHFHVYILGLELMDYAFRVAFEET